MKPLFTTCCLLFTMVLFSQDKIEDHFKVYDTRIKQIVSLDKIIQDCTNADVLFFGEEHNDSACHYMESTIFTALHKQFGDRLVLSMEMFETDGQLALDEYLDGYITESRMMTDTRAWSNYKDYRPMVEYAKANKIPVIAANPPRRYVNMVSRKGMRSLDSLSAASKKFLPPLPYDTLSGRYRQKFEEIMKGSPGSTSGNIYYSQNLWDAGMSYSIYYYLKKHKRQKVFHCVGKFHCDEKLGTAAQLQKRNPRLRILNISSFSDPSFANPDWDKFTSLGDYIILTDPNLKKTF
jgi:uncharacterized iron-regulated protein